MHGGCYLFISQVTEKLGAFGERFAYVRHHHGPHKSRIRRWPEQEIHYEGKGAVGV